MRVHREGYRIILISFLLFSAICFAFLVLANPLVFKIVLVASILLFLFILRFFRFPRRVIPCNNSKVYSPCDGKVVAIEEVDEPEFLKTRCIQVSIFMSVWNVHINWYPIAGRVAYQRYHPGKYLVAWNPKSSEENERTTVVVERADGTMVLLRQIAGFLARRIVCYAKVDVPIGQCKQVGFIKFGSRVDLFLPLGTDIDVAIGQKVVGTKTVVATLPIKD